MSLMSQYTTYLADSLTDGDSRKLIAGWWYSILAMTGILALMCCAIAGAKSFSEVFASFWSAVMLVALSIGGTMIMRKFHNSMAVGFFMGSVVAMAQMFFFLSLIYLGHRRDNLDDGLPSKQELLMSFLCLVQSVLLGSFAAILGAHRSEIMEKETGSTMDGSETYDPPHSIS